MFRKPGAVSLRLLLLFLFVLVAASAAQAVSMDRSASTKDYCQAFLGADAVQMWGYLPDAPSHQYCEDIPATGPAILTFDLLTQVLRETPIEVRIVRAPLKPLDDDTDLAPITVAHLDAKTYGNGVITITHNFVESGLYVAVVTATDQITGERKTARFSFTVGHSFITYLPILLGALFMAGLVAIYWRHGAPTWKT